MAIAPLILGRGRAGDAIAKSFAILRILRPELALEPPVWLERDCSLAEARQRYDKPVLCIANPHGLHAPTLLAADRAGFAAIVCEKPAGVNQRDVAQLREITTPTAILHVYRQMWGPQTLKAMLAAGEFGDVISIEGRYWQASTAERARKRDANPCWKDEIRLSGEYDTFLDVASHWIDAASFLAGARPSRIIGRRSYVNAASAHRDSHVQLMIDFPSTSGWASVSKTLHGATNHFELNIIGATRSAHWEFMNPDEIVVGEGRERRIFSRQNVSIGSRQGPHHGLGWLEGYVEIASRLMTEISGGARESYPRLQENLETLGAMFDTQWLSS